MEEKWLARPFTEAHAREVCTWRYEGPYAVYDLPCWEEALAHGYALCQPEARQRQYVAATEGESLVGFFQLREQEGCFVLGVGLRPDLCGRGLGGRLMALALAEADRRRPGWPVRLIVRVFNARAIRAYEKAGFVITGRSVVETPTGPTEMVNMEHLPQ